jgi:hypothetical protein
MFIYAKICVKNEINSTFTNQTHNFEDYKLFWDDNLPYYGPHEGQLSFARDFELSTKIDFLVLYDLIDTFDKTLIPNIPKSCKD